MESENYVHVIEVKTLTTPMFVSVSDNVDKRKRINLINAAKGYMARYKVVKEVKFDVVSVVFVNNEPEVEYIPDAFLPIYGA